MWLLQPPKEGSYQTGNMGEANHMSHNVRKYKYLYYSLIWSKIILLTKRQVSCGDKEQRLREPTSLSQWGKKKEAVEYIDLNIW